jgi:hypothetical protein
MRCVAAGSCPSGPREMSILCTIGSEAGPAREEDALMIEGLYTPRREKGLRDWGRGRRVWAPSGVEGGRSNR